MNSQGTKVFTTVKAHYKDITQRQQQCEEVIKMSYLSSSPSWRREVSNRFKVLQNQEFNYEEDGIDDDYQMTRSIPQDADC